MVMKYWYRLQEELKSLFARMTCFKLGADRFLLVVDNYEKKEELNVLAEKLQTYLKIP